MRKFLLWGVFFGVVARAADKPLRVLTYSSATGKASLSELVAESGVAMTFVTTDRTASLLGRLRSDRRRKRSGADLVLGLARSEFEQAQREKLLGEGAVVYSRTPYALIVDTERWPKSQWPKTWAQAAVALKKSVVMADPRISTVGRGFLDIVYGRKLLTPKQARDMIVRTYPSWSLAYEAFLKGEGKAVWSVRSSEAYHRCREKTDRYVVLPLEEGYSWHEEWLAPVAGTSVPERLKTWITGDVFQRRVPEMNWVYPVREGATLPACFENVTPVNAWVAETGADVVDRWTEDSST